ncbi:MAG: hypothetical protein ACRET5_10850, partial [Steroidobacteraceae bacterium]
VETEEQIGALWNMGCDEAQGYLFSRPMPCEELAQLLEHGNGRIPGPVAGRVEPPGEAVVKDHCRRR